LINSSGTVWALWHEQADPHYAVNFNLNGGSWTADPMEPGFRLVPGGFWASPT